MVLPVLWSLGHDVIVPDSDETVAAGAAVQAAAVVGDEQIAAITARWQLGTGTTVAPASDGEQIRRRYFTAT